MAQPETLRPSNRLLQGRTIARLWADAVAQSRSTPAYLVERDGGWHEVSWAEAATAVEELANGLLALGISKGDAFAIIGQTSLEWALFDFALASVGAVGTPVYANSSAKDARYVVEHSESVGALCEDGEQRAKLAPLGLAHTLTFADLDDLRTRGREFAAAHPDALRAAMDAIREDDLYTYIYTSGTTGPPKGCMIRNRNYYAMVAVVDDMASLTLPGDVMLLYLPLAHNFGRLMHLAGAYVGYTVAFLPDPLRTAEALLEVRPTVLPSVPRVFEKVHAAVLQRFAEETGVKRKLIDRALRVGYRVSALEQRGERIPPGLALQHRLADMLVLSKVRDRLGGRLRAAISGGAPLAKEIIEFFHALGVLIVEAYGLTEVTSGATSNRVDHYRFGSVGPALPGVELKLLADGELLIRGPMNFAGYLKDEAATREVLDDEGWLHTGDIAQIDDDGFVTITDRKKDLIVTAGGKNVAPANLENDLKMHPEISQALVIGDRRPFIAALITLDPETTASLSAAQKHERVQAVVDAVNRDRSRYEQIKKFTILPRDFSAEEGEVTPTLKLKRRVVEQHFATDIDGIYSA
ncbi:MAG: AMP-dependent synthetase/ligase [Gaiellaceae bacterium]